MQPIHFPLSAANGPTSDCLALVRLREKSLPLCANVGTAVEVRA
jgi:hypothetical protein